MIVEKSFIDAISYAKKHSVLIRPEYWSQWIRYDKDSTTFYWCNKYGENDKWHGIDKAVVLCDKIADITKWEFMCDELVEDSVEDNDD